MNIEKLSTYWCKIIMAGDIAVAKQILRREVKTRGLCVTIEPTTFIYTGGEELGFVVGLINYPKFPKVESEVYNTSLELLSILRYELYQDSALLQTPETTEWFSDRSR